MSDRARAAEIEIRAEDYDSAVARALVVALGLEVDARYADDADDADADLLDRMIVRANEVRPPEGAFLVAWSAGAALGCGAVRRHDASTGEVKRMYTVPEARRRGVSRALLAALEEEARALGYARLVLETGLRQPEAIELYRSVGWTPAEPYGAYVRSPISVYLTKDLARP